MKPIKACGNIKQEPVMHIKNCDTIAARMLAVGITRNAEYVEMIDDQVKSGQLSDKVADFVRLSVSRRIIKNTGNYVLFLESVKLALHDLLYDEQSPYCQNLLTKKREWKDAVVMADRMTKKYPQAEKVLTDQEKKAVKYIVSGMAEPISDMAEPISDIDKSSAEIELDKFIAVLKHKTLGLIDGNHVKNTDFIHIDLNAELDNEPSDQNDTSQHNECNCGESCCTYTGKPCCSDQKNEHSVSGVDALREASHQEDVELIDKMRTSTEEEIQTAIRVIQRINYRSAYGHDQKLCSATGEVLMALQPKDKDIASQVLKEYEQLSDHIEGALGMEPRQLWNKTRNR